MKILAIIGSPRKNKFTYTYTKLFESELKKIKKIDFEYLFLSDYNIGFCQGCFQCVLYGAEKCKYHKAVNEILTKMHNADGIILSCPSYVDNVTGLLKNFIDHIIFEVHRPSFTDKYAFILGLAIGSGTNEVVTYLKNTLYKLGFSVEGMYKIYLPRFSENKNIQRIRKRCRKFLHAIENKKPVRPNFKAVMYFKISKITLKYMRMDGFEIDYNYWVEKKIINSNYYRPAKINFFITLITNLISWIIERQMRKRIKTKNGDDFVSKLL